MFRSNLDTICNTGNLGFIGLHHQSSLNNMTETIKSITSPIHREASKKSMERIYEIEWMLHIVNKYRDKLWDEWQERFDAACATVEKWKKPKKGEEDASDGYIDICDGNFALSAFAI